MHEESHLNIMYHCLSSHYSAIRTTRLTGRFEIVRFSGSKSRHVHSALCASIPIRGNLPPLKRLLLGLEGGNQSQIMSSILSYVASGFGLFAVAAVALFTAAAHAPTAPFFWHPISMVLSFGFFMVQGVLILVSKHSLLHVAAEFVERKLKVDTHFWCQARPFRVHFTADPFIRPSRTLPAWFG
jgi:hypothetical protein